MRLRRDSYRHLFAAQVIALIGTDMMTVALGLLAYKIAGDRAGAVLGTALAIEMVATSPSLPWSEVSPISCPPRLSGLNGHRTRRRGAGAAFRRSGLAGVPADLRAAVGVRGLHADVPGHHPRRASGRGPVLDLAPKTARLVDDIGGDHEVALDNLNVGDKLRVRPGENVPVDGIVLEGRSSLDESLVS
ncbi:MAG: cation translocating P-type ATPase [Rhizobium sp.]|nr:cation translocating P-type ATPase [Rhizobium sp.]